MSYTALDRLARNLDDLRRIVQTLTGRGVRIEFVKERLLFTGEGLSNGQPHALCDKRLLNLKGRLSMRGSGRGLPLPNSGECIKGGRDLWRSLMLSRLRERLASGISKAEAAREFGISRQTLYQYLKGVETAL